MPKTNSKSFPSFREGYFSTQPSGITTEKIYMGSRVCDNCGKTKDVSGGKSCSKGHFICHSCASSHIHCPLCGHTLR